MLRKAADNNDSDDTFHPLDPHRHTSAMDGILASTVA